MNEYRQWLETRSSLDPRLANLPVWTEDMIRLEREFSAITEAFEKRYRIPFDVAWNELAVLLNFDPELWSNGSPE